MNTRSQCYGVLFLLTLMVVSRTSVLSAQGTHMDWYSINAGGKARLDGSGLSLGQSAVGTSSSGSLRMEWGFWQQTGVCHCGDADGSGGTPDISDAVFLIAYIFGGGPAPNPLCNGDADGSGGTPDISDAVFLIAYIFGGGPAPCCFGPCK